MIDPSPPGSWRAALAPDASCAACGQAVCGHPDAIYQGVVPYSSVPAIRDPVRVGGGGVLIPRKMARQIECVFTQLSVDQRGAG